MGMFAVPAVIVPAIELEDFGAPDILAHGWEMDWSDPEMIVGISYVERIERHRLRRQVACRVHYPRSRWMAAYNATKAGLLGH